MLIGAHAALATALAYGSLRDDSRVDNPDPSPSPRHHQHREVGPLQAVAVGPSEAVALRYGESRELFEFFPARVEWMWTQIQPTELAAVRYIEYSYWNELSGGSRLAVDAARRIDEGVRPFGVSNARFRAAADAVRDGVRFPPLILAGPLHNELVCLEGNLRLTAYALAGFPVHLECLTGVSPALRRWAD